MKNTKNLLALRPQVFLRLIPYFYYIAVRNISHYSDFVSSNSPYGLDSARAARSSGLFFARCKRRVVAGAAQ
ncbi:hypothetical protein CPter91_3582 [Collimonas pratensis]|uniref:Uncharacterized protein n=1 Tax=Collimonas pratensis TaxID=279113 RepID=A0A127Q798_9BURK|nr:hypothetical protein CPter91_3582 [Collimonas pratensis]